MKNEFTGCGPFLHDDARDRPTAIYGGETTIHLGGGRENFVLLPVIPEKVTTGRSKLISRAGKAMLDEVVAAHREEEVEKRSRRRRKATTMPGRRRP
jgi:hypothetical protein